MEFTAKVRTCLWFDSQGEEAARFYVSLLPDSQIENAVRPDPERATLGGRVQTSRCSLHDFERRAALRLERGGVDLGADRGPG